MTDNELNALIAEEVMGGVLAVARTTPSGRFVPFRPSTNIADAWLVMEAMRARRWAFSLNSDCPHWYARFVSDDGSEIEGMATTAPRAICEAALAAVRAWPKAKEAR